MAQITVVLSKATYTRGEHMTLRVEEQEDIHNQRRLVTIKDTSGAIWDLEKDILHDPVYGATCVASADGMQTVFVTMECEDGSSLCETASYEVVGRPTCCTSNQHHGPWAA